MAATTPNARKDVDALALAEELAGGGRVQDLSGGSKALGINRSFRLYGEEGTKILKIYGTPARERREHHALGALRGIEGLPTILERGGSDDTVWAMFGDAGRWTLAALPENPGMARKAGEILRAVHDSAPNPVSNLARGIDQEWVTVDFNSTFRRLERYRGRVGLSAEVLEAAKRVRPPYASEPRAAHTDPKPSNFLVDDDGNVTLISWEWATLAPPEWDLSKATWLLGFRSGPAAADALQDGYGRHLDPEQLDRWIVYHAAMSLVWEAEQKVSGGPKEIYEDTVAELQRAVTGATSKN
jgi:Ser/Thr protein kinase RdoA (MazF antagonist)